MSRGWALAALLVCLAGATARAGDLDLAPAPAGGEPARDEETTARVTLVKSRVAAADAAQRDRAAAEIGASSAWRDLLAAYRDVHGDFRRPEQGDLVLEALARSGAAKLREMLAAAAAKGADPFLVVVALRVAALPSAEVPMADVLAVALAIPAEERPSQWVQSLVKDAVAAALDRRAGDSDALRQKWASLDVCFRAACLEGVVSVRRASSARILSRLLDTGAPGDGEILRRLATAPVREEHPFDPSLETFLPRTLSAEDADLRAGAALFSGRYAGTETAEALHALLSDGDPRVVSAAHRALEAATGSPLARDAELWRVRLDGERSWAEGSREGDLAAARGEDPVLAVLALGRLGQHRLHGVALAPTVEGLADHADPAVRTAACETLGRLGRTSSLRALLRAAEDPAPAVASAASRALASVTGLPAPEAPADWQRVLEPRADRP